MNRGIDNMSVPVSEQGRDENAGVSGVILSESSLPVPPEELQIPREGELKAVP